jgi:hypothetical protein
MRKLKGRSPDDLSFDDDSPQPLPKKRGPKPAILEEGYRQHRDNMIWFLDSNWPELLVLFKKTKTTGQLYTGLQHWRTPPPDENGKYQMTSPFDQQARLLMEHINDLQEFLQSPRFAGKSRNLASAMVGLLWPVTWRYALDYGQKLDREGRIFSSPGQRAMLDHFRREHPAVYHEMRAGRFEQAALALKESKRKCCKFWCDKSDRLEDFWQAGQAGASVLT